MNELRKLFSETLAFLEDGFRRLEDRVPPPVWERTDLGLRARYLERTIEQALIQKLFRTISGLHALEVLLVNGLAQEQGVIQRVLDELSEDIQFLGLAVTSGEVTPLQKTYLADFWAEEFDHPDPLQATQKRKTVSREKILSHNARAFITKNPEKDKTVRRTLHKAYSGFVHGASSHIMDMCGGDPPRFYFKVPSGEPRLVAQVHDALNYFYRGLLALGTVSLVMKNQPLWDEVCAYLKGFEKASGVRFSEVQ